MDGKNPRSTDAANGYFSAVFSQQCAEQVKGRNGATSSDLSTMLSKQHAFVGKNGSTHSGTADGKPHGSPTKSSGSVYKDSNHHYEPAAESPYFGSSVHYGGREFFGSSPAKYDGSSVKNEKGDYHDESVATRGDWWQGSLYY